MLETQADHFLKVLEDGSVSTNIYLRRIHNFALDMSWLPWPVLPKKRWPAIKFKEKHAIKWDEHEAIVARELNPERKAFYQLAWHLGASQSDIAFLVAENIDWDQNVLSFARKKTGSIALMRFDDETAQVLRSLRNSHNCQCYREDRQFDRTHKTSPLKSSEPRWRQKLQAIFRVLPQ